MDFSRHMNRILELDPARKIARVQPGVILDDLRREAERHHLTFAPILPRTPTIPWAA